MNMNLTLKIWRQKNASDKGEEWLIIKSAIFHQICLSLKC